MAAAMETNDMEAVNLAYYCVSKALKQYDYIWNDCPSIPTLPKYAEAMYKLCNRPDDDELDFAILLDW